VKGIIVFSAADVSISVDFVKKINHFISTQKIWSLRQLWQRLVKNFITTKIYKS